MDTMTQTKKIDIVSDHPLKKVRVDAEPQTTASEILQKAGFNPNQFHLIKKGDPDQYEPEALPFADLNDGEKLHVLPESSVGRN